LNYNPRHSILAPWSTFEHAWLVELWEDCEHSWLKKHNGKLVWSNCV
jgi:hypothetical protein